MGGLLVPAVMDLAWLEAHLKPAGELHRRLGRLIDTSSGREHRACAAQSPPAEPDVNPAAAIALLRSAQAALTLILQCAWVRRATLIVSTGDGLLTLTVTGSGSSNTAAAQHEGRDPYEQRSREAYELAAMHHRSAALGGDFVLAQGAPRELRISARLPLDTLA